MIILYCYRVECLLRGREVRIIVGMHCAELIPELERERYREQIQRKLEGHTALVTHQRQYVHDNGRKVTV